MGMRLWLRSLLVAAVLLAATAVAGEPVVVATVDPDAAVRQVQERKTAAYAGVVDQFDAAMRTSPDDATVAVARCRFIGNFVDEEYGEYVESAAQQFEDCRKAIEKRWPKEPVAQLFELDQLWGEEAVEQGEILVKQGDRWAVPLRRELLTKVSEAQQSEGNEKRAGELALIAVRLGCPTCVGPAVKYLASNNQAAAAVKLLQSAPPATDSWLAKGRIEAAMTLPDTKAALKEARRYADAQFEIDAAVIAGAHLRAGDVAAARKLLAQKTYKSKALQTLRFDAALAANDFKAAAKLVDLTDMQDLSANIARYGTLAARSPSTLWTAPMLLSTLLVLLMLTAVALSPALVLVPVHYRGLIRRVGGKAAQPLFESIGLRHAWFGAFISLCMPVIVGLVIEPQAMAQLLEGKAVPEPVALFRMLLWGTVVGLLCVAPMMIRAMGMRHVLGDRVVLRSSGWVLVAWGVLMVVSMLNAAWTGHIGAGDTTHTRTMAALAVGGREGYGPFVSLLLVAVLVPVLEELTFRGLLLGGLSRHISFGWANTLQAALFATMHDDAPRIPFYFAMGLLAGWLVRRNRALGPAIALHALNNGLVFSLRMF